MMQETGGTGTREVLKFESSKVLKFLRSALVMQETGETGTREVLKFESSKVLKFLRSALVR